MRVLFGIVLLMFLLSSGHAQPASGTTSLFDSGWRFHRGGAQGAEKPEFNDKTWRAIDLPHDWSIEDLPGTASPFSPDAPSQVSGGFTTGGSGWYRKTFELPAGAAGQRVQLMFEGVYMNAEVWVNGQSLGRHPYGYTSFWHDVTDLVKPTGPNVVAVEVHNQGANSRWYSGSGIYRHVWLSVRAPVHVAHLLYHAGGDGRRGAGAGRYHARQQKRPSRGGDAHNPDSQCQGPGSGQNRI
ncbi:sugar-binding domain-containing protein [Hymenobacter arizonensis]|uniref:sugar-binding domain-containing protein n=1 Tax=Hymenobacter arizonensis TaxID=1227077 RepID=UPI000A76D3AD|nr:sugar-binding domain-containing protein [Hymenobacter arizonensis]